jgi:hypothetical protein
MWSSASGQWDGPLRLVGLWVGYRALKKSRWKTISSAPSMKREKGEMVLRTRTQPNQDDTYPLSSKPKFPLRLISITSLRVCISAVHILSHTRHALHHQPISLFKINNFEYLSTPSLNFFPSTTLCLIFLTLVQMFQPLHFKFLPAIFFKGHKAFIIHLWFRPQYFMELSNQILQWSNTSLSLMYWDVTCNLSIITSKRRNLSSLFITRHLD